MYRSARAVLTSVVGLSVGLMAALASAQVTRAEYQRAGSLNQSLRKAAVGFPSEPTWVAGEHSVVYAVSTAAGRQFVLVNAETLQKQTAFDHVRLADALNKASGQQVKAEALPLYGLQLMEQHRAIEFSAVGSRWHCELTTYTCHAIDTGEDTQQAEGDARGPQLPWAANSLKQTTASPDGKLVALVENYNVVVQRPDGTHRTVLSTDGSEGNYYDLSSLRWSPDATHLAIYRVRPGYKRLVHYVESSPKTQLQPLYLSLVYAKPGDVLDLQQPVLFDVAAARELPVAPELFPNPFELGELAWNGDSHAVTFAYNQRGHQVYRIIEVAAATGVARALITEESATFINYEPLIQDPEDTGKIFRHDVPGGREIVWASERDGWEHLYLVDRQAGAMRQITHGAWPVRAVTWVDDVHRQIYFEASGISAEEDPYFVHSYRINFDGTGMVPLVEAAGTHQTIFSSDGRYFLDLGSTVSTAPVLSLYETKAVHKLADLETPTLDALKAAGWRPPEPFASKGRDNKTEIWGVIWKPANFDPAKKYPVIEDIYAGPQGSFVPKSFSPRVEPLTELGFVVVQIDGMGTNNRSRAFHDVAWKNLKDAGFPDRIMWHKAAAAKYPWYDISNVGIFGTSAGGQSAMGALLFHPEFYKVAVANSGCHDNRMDKIWWNEQWMGWPIGPQYAASSNVDNAYRLTGKLMLVVGELDDNVDPSSTFQVADRLERANKFFDLLYVPGGHHGAGGDYGQRKLQDFFVHNILHQETPTWNDETAPAPNGGR